MSPTIELLCGHRSIRHFTDEPVTDAQLGLAEQLLLGVVDTAMMGQNALTAAESLGLGGVYIGGIRNNIESVTELLKLPKHVLPLFWPVFWDGLRIIRS